ncbi:MAG TPA: ComF family protein, partial [Stellaceae bacterium]|nr:ComF family protein [Stellaceae bacterium]
GQPFPYDPGPKVLCPSCIAEPPPFDRARAAFAYDDHSRRLVLALKHADRQHGLGAFGQWLARAGSELLAEADIVAPIPLHWTRLFARRFNQSAMLAQAALAANAKATSVAEAKAGHAPPRFEPLLLTRHKRTPPQGRRSRRGRAANVQGAFRLSAGMDVKGRRILLIDDVLTTGATIAECARVLRRAGAARVDVLTLARVIRD